MQTPFCTRHFSLVSLTTGTVPEAPVVSEKQKIDMQSSLCGAREAYHNSIGRMHQCSQLIEIILSLEKKQRECDREEGQKNKW